MGKLGWVWYDGGEGGGIVFLEYEGEGGMGNEKKHKVCELKEDDIKQIAEYDLKYRFVENAKKLKKIDVLFEELKLERKRDVKSYFEWGQKYKENTYRDLDHSNGSFPPMGVIYEVLWGWGCDKNKVFRRFKVTSLFNEVLFGGDWIYSLGSCKDNDEEAYRIRGCMGTFTLVPAYFNRYGHGAKDWGKALSILKEEDWKIEEKVRGERGKKDFKEMGFSSHFECGKEHEENYRKYINAMFLWD